MENTSFIGKVCHRFDELASTNDYARQLLAKHNPDNGTAILADNQTAGRGQYGRQWLSEAGTALTVSYILYPHQLRAEHLHLLSQVIALTVTDTIATWANEQSVYIKWPNDIYLGNQKVAGILIENGLNPDGLVAHSVIGIGINVGQKWFSPDLPHATSLHLHTGQEIAIEEVYEKLCACLNQRYPLLHALNFEQVRDEYQNRMFGLGVLAEFETQHSELLQAEIVGIDYQNRLLLRQSDGAVTAWVHGNIRMRL